MNKIFLFISFILLISCLPRHENKTDSEDNHFSRKDSIYYADGFRIETHTDYKLVQLMNPWKKENILETYILCSKSKSLPADLPEGILIRTPLQKTVSFSAVICGFLQELDVLSTLIGVAEPQYINLSYIDDGIRDGKIEDIGQAANPNIEKLILIEPEAVFTNPINDSGINFLNKLKKPVINCFEYMETNPLGQAEWIRFFGLLFEKENFADSLFFETVNGYNELRDLTIGVTSRPTVFTELKYGDFWYMPGGKSYMAHILEDAGAEYILRNDDHSGSVSFSFETIFDKAGEADYWLFKYYSPSEMNYTQLKKENKNYSFFKAYQTKKVYACNTLNIINYYQELPLHPDWILKDLIWIFHRDLLPEYSPRYYKPLEK